MTTKTDKNAIIVENLGKSYVINHQLKGHGSYVALRDVIVDKVRLLFNPSRWRGMSRETFWAVKDVNFSVHKGDKVAIIGHNGAGKSTLLKLLSQITEPTTGKITLNGRVSSLLEVGTGFHPELTGRENIYLNGSILGMTRAEVKQKFAEIVAFAGVEKFLDTPVKRYSSGMRMRLGFAVAAHLESEILVIDEVLAVGDAAFQQKCLGKMDEIAAGEGRTILFVSHNMASVKALCNKGILLQQGQITAMGDVADVVDQYERAVKEHAGLSGEVKQRDPAVVWHGIANRAAVSQITPQQQFNLAFRFEVSETIPEVMFDVLLQNERGEDVSHLLSRNHNQYFTLKQGICTFNITFDAPEFSPGRYSCGIYLGTKHKARTLFHALNIDAFDIINHNPYCTNQLLPSQLIGVMTPHYTLDLSYES